MRILNKLGRFTAKLRALLNTSGEIQDIARAQRVIQKDQFDILKQMKALTPEVSVNDSVTLKALIEKIPPHVNVSNHREILIWMDALLAEYYMLSEMVIKRDEEIANLKKQKSHLTTQMMKDWENSMSPAGVSLHDY